MAGNTSTPGATVTSRVLAVLGAFDAGHRELRLTDIAERSGLPAPTVHRLLGELVAGGALGRRTDGRYTVGHRLWKLGLLAPVQTGLREVAAPHLQDLYGATLATVHLAVREGTTALYVERISGNASVPVVSRTGSRLPLYATAVGKVLLAHAPDRVQQAVLADLQPITRHTVTQPARLRRQLTRCLTDGSAQTHEEMTLGACSVAVPVRRPSGQVVAALGVVVPSLDARTSSRLVAAMGVAARGIGRELGDLSAE